MAFNHSNEPLEQRKARLAAKAAADQAAKNNGKNIRCGSGQGFITTVTGPDGRKIPKYVYGRNGD